MSMNRCRGGLVPWTSTTARAAGEGVAVDDFAADNFDHRTRLHRRWKFVKLRSLAHVAAA
jgi:hypothetical protein